MKSLIALLQVLMLSLVMTGCSDKLSTGKAEKIIKASIKFPVIEKEVIEYGIVSHNRDSLPNYYYKLAKQGLFTLEYLKKSYTFGFGTSYLFRVTPTEAAKKFFKEDTSPEKDTETGEMCYRGWFKTCEVLFEKVKEIVEIPAFNGAEIAYQVRRTNFTPFWEVYSDRTRIMPDTVQIKRFSALKTNNGWKAAR